MERFWYTAVVICFIPTSWRPHVKVIDKVVVVVPVDEMLRPHVGFQVVEQVLAVPSGDKLHPRVDLEMPHVQVIREIEDVPDSDMFHPHVGKETPHVPSGHHVFQVEWR